MLDKIAGSIRKNKNILEKKEINPIIKYIDSNTFKSSRIFSALGEDSAAIKNKDTYILVTTDRIITSFIENYPFGAGFSSILVSVDDIYACGGNPLAASIILSYKNTNVGEKILEGISEASNKFQIPIVRGHTNPNGQCYELSSTLIGEIKKEYYISAGGAQVGDKLILAVDFDGRVGKASKLFFDTTTFKPSETVLKRRRSMNRIAKLKLATAAKDISNGGIFGTTLQLIKYSGVGIDINVNQIIIPPILQKLKYTLELYSKMYLTTSFILTVSEKNTKKMIHTFKEYGMNANIIGKIIDEENLLRIHDDNKSIDVIKF
ncbi:MAG: hypothetical protein GF317_24280 [Candidatus Lokiarchaeota archaeon]|nr:hypothetical protein [Candidatus Lokiarchaeota archaeon]MBD3202492.1 hypothetical protein [Candidatus Lokiarchaeota archaeon]